MKVYFSGIAGTGIGPLAEIAHDLGYEVCGSDWRRGAISGELDKRNIKVAYGEQDGEFLRQMHADGGVDWYVQTSALRADHAELAVAKELGLKISKRDEFLAEIIEEKQLKLLAMAGTHGKTTTTAMTTWVLKGLGIPVSYSIGTTINWAAAGCYDPESQFFVYEADEYDRNFLKYHPYIATLISVEYDHPDIYPTQADYLEAFAQFESQSEHVIKNVPIDERITIVGKVRRQDASFVLAIMQKLRAEGLIEATDEDIIKLLNDYPGAGRRFERIAEGVYSDYGHLPSELRATIDMSHELKDRDGFTGLCLVYQPLQNLRQYEVRDEYPELFMDVDRLFWVPTFLIRDNSGLPELRPADFVKDLKNKEIAEATDLNDDLREKLLTLHEKGWLIVMIAGGDADPWIRQVFAGSGD